MATNAPGSGLVPPSHTKSDEALRRVAMDLEATFLSEMLKHAGVGKTPETFGGGVGEDQFASFLRNAQADEIASRGGIGLAESIFNSLKERSHVE
ncbi:rod-binding protein [Tropicimonas sp. TH_r6]|uniref:rod-binding protein n=1 Tax=Tropicimonas sp. TH_r6 TaxID=3082085 RepID=UPI00295570D4|nr:rod-binding protein [Tropicimonas sp. TH_r6]MDV7144777.1 rod-binding protein [Tropicimonas sp. TH_r6]